MDSRHDAALPGRLLGIGLPLTVGAGGVVAWALFDLEVWQAALVGAVLAPTDAALGQVVVTSRRVPLRVRQALNVESGLDDGVAAPLVTMFIAGAAAAEGFGSPSPCSPPRPPPRAGATASSPPSSPRCSTGSTRGSRCTRS